MSLTQRRRSTKNDLPQCLISTLRRHKCRRADKQRWIYLSGAPVYLRRRRKEGDGDNRRRIYAYLGGAPVQVGASKREEWTSEGSTQEAYRNKQAPQTQTRDQHKRIHEEWGTKDEDQDQRWTIY